jgi:hypothetical protein
MLSVNLVEPMNSSVPRRSNVRSGDSAATTPMTASAHHGACSKKKSGCRE